MGKKLPQWFNASTMKQWADEALDVRGNIWAMRLVVVVKYFEVMLEKEIQKNVERKAG